MPLTFKIRGFPDPIEGISVDATFEELKIAIMSMTGVAIDSQVIKSGFPPKDLAGLLNPHDHIRSVLRNKETLVLEKSKSGLPNRSVQLPQKTQNKTCPDRKKSKRSSKPKKPSKKRARPPKPSTLHLATESNPIDTALSEMGAGLAQAAAAAGGDPAMDYFRAALNEGLKGAQALSMGSARLHSALAKKYQFEEGKAYRLSDGQQSRITVKFKDISNKKYEEFVDLYPAVLVKAVLTQVAQSGGVDFLRPYHMARCSPRMFWSVVRLYGPDVEASLQQLVPSADWVSLSTRKRRKSAKALENERQAEAERLKKAARQALRDILNSSPTAVVTTTATTSAPNTTTTSSAPNMEVKQPPAKGPQLDEKKPSPKMIESPADEASNSVCTSTSSSNQQSKAQAAVKRKKRFRPGVRAGSRAFGGK